MELDLQEIINEQLWDSMIAAGKEEAELAKNNGELVKDGIPEIAVIADGAKRSYKTKYEAKSGEACNIGYKTGKLLFLGIRNKFCSMCLKHEKGDVPPHRCFNNWEKSLTSIESNVITEGFCSSLQMHGMKYKYLIGDGDSSVYKNLCEFRPYGPNYHIIKIECKNHLLRNFCSRLKDITFKKHSSSGKLIPVDLRQYLRENIRRL